MPVRQGRSWEGRSWEVRAVEVTAGSQACRRGGGEKVADVVRSAGGGI